MKATLIICLDCNMSCSYCYMVKRQAVMTMSTAARIIDFLHQHLQKSEKLEIGFFGGEPLLQLDLIEKIIRAVEKHPVSDGRQTGYQIVTNGTLLTEENLDIIKELGIYLGISCDGIPIVHDKYRRYTDGSPSSADVKSGISLAVKKLPRVMVNSVFNPNTVETLPETVKYLYSLGVRDICLNANYSAPWKENNLPTVEKAYNETAELYKDYYLKGDPASINLIDSKIILLLNGGYSPEERCSMGSGELAFGPEGNIYPCERLAGDCVSGNHCIGHIDTGAVLSCAVIKKKHEEELVTACKTCSLEKYCMHWCGCSNYFSSRSYGKPGPFICASEKLSIKAAFNVFEDLSASMGAVYLQSLERRHCSC